MNPTIEAWIVIEKLGQLCATPGISMEVQKLANEQIERMIKDVITPDLGKLSAKKAGIIL